MELVPLSCTCTRSNIYSQNWATVTEEQCHVNDACGVEGCTGKSNKNDNRISATAEIAHNADVRALSMSL